MDENIPRKKVGHEIGQVLDELSVSEIDARIAVLRGEIDRLETAKRQKQSSLDAAGAFFKRPTSDKPT